MRWVACIVFVGDGSGVAVYIINMNIVYLEELLDTRSNIH